MGSAADSPGGISHGVERLLSLLPHLAYSMCAGADPVNEPRGSSRVELLQRSFRNPRCAACQVRRVTLPARIPKLPGRPVWSPELDGCRSNEHAGAAVPAA